MKNFSPATDITNKVIKEYKEKHNKNYEIEVFRVDLFSMLNQTFGLMNSVLESNMSRNAKLNVLTIIRDNAGSYIHNLEQLTTSLSDILVQEMFEKLRTYIFCTLDTKYKRTIQGL